MMGQLSPSDLTCQTMRKRYKLPVYLKELRQTESLVYSTRAFLRTSPLNHATTAPYTPIFRALAGRRYSDKTMR